MTKSILIGAWLLGSATMASAQQPSGRAADTTRVDSTRAQRLSEITVTVTDRPSETLQRTPVSAAVLDLPQVRRGQATIGLDESLNSIPGVYIANRYNFSLDQRISIRGSGSRAAFGTRGVKVLLDGIPQTTPDGQSQFSNVDLANVGRVEVIRGAASSLFGNASGGVISLTSEAAPASPFAQSATVEGGSFGLVKYQARTAIRQGDVAATLSLSRLQWDGFRQQSTTDQRQLNFGLDWMASGSTQLGLRFNAADAPRAANPGALTAREYYQNADSASGSNILRGADKAVQQQQLGLTARHTSARGDLYEASIFGYLRTLTNPTSTASTVQPGANVGTYIQLDRKVAGSRVSGTWALGSAAEAPRLSVGADAQIMRDTRLNLRSVAGVPSTPTVTLLNQLENVDQVAPFAQLTWAPTSQWFLGAGVRYDWFQFATTDLFLSDGDQSGSRTMSSMSANVGASYVARPELVPYVNLSTGFETPTTNELSVRADGLGGFNPTLGPQRAVNLEVGVRGQVGATRWLTYSATAFRVWLSDAIVQYQSIDQRNYFTNAGKVTNQGIEAGVQAHLLNGLQVNVAYTLADYTFTDYKVQRAAGGQLVADTLDGKALPGVPRHFLRVELRTRPIDQLRLDADLTVASQLFTDDKNTATGCAALAGLAAAAQTACVVDGYGVVNTRLTWEGRSHNLRLQPFLGIYNLFDATYLGSVTINGAAGRVLEPAPRRNVYLGAVLAFR